MSDVSLVTTHKRGAKTLSVDVERYDSITAARADMREYLGGFIDDGWLRVPNVKPLRKKPVTMAVKTGDDERITCTIVVVNGRRSNNAHAWVNTMDD